MSVLMGRSKLIVRENACQYNLKTAAGNTFNTSAVIEFSALEL